MSVMMITVNLGNFEQYDTLLISIVLGVEMDSSNVKNIWNNWSETWYQKKQKR